MHLLNVRELEIVSGGDFFGPMVNSIMSGMTDHEKAFTVTGFGLGLVAGGYIGKWWAIGAGVIGTSAYVGWDWYSASNGSESTAQE